MKRSSGLSHVAIIAGAALAAMTVGHGLVSFVGAAAGYRHALQGPAIELALVLLFSGAAIAFGRLLRSMRGCPAERDWALLAFQTIRDIGALRLVTLVIGLQLVSLCVGESLEQRVAGVTVTGIAGFFGSTLLVAPVIHLAVGVIAGWVLWISAREICRHASLAFALVRAVIAWISRETTAITGLTDRIINVLCGPQSQPIAFKLSNRPPPYSVRV